MVRSNLTLFALLAALVPILGCTPLRPYAEIRTQVPGELIDVSGVEVHVETAGAGEPVVLVHGFGGSTYSWRYLMPELAKTHRVVAIDLFGFGYTRRPEGLRFYTRESQVQLILEVMDALEIEKAHLVGHSYGGGLSASLAAWNPDRVLSLTLVDSTAPNWAKARRKNFAELAPLTYTFVRGLALQRKMVRKALLRSYFDDSQVTEETVEAYLARLRIEGAARAYRGLTVPLEPGADGEDVHFTDLQLPVLVVWGEEDSLIDIEHGRVAAEEMPLSRFVSLAEAGHSPMEEQPEALLQAIRPFLADPEGHLAQEEAARETAG